MYGYRIKLPDNIVKRDISNISKRYNLLLITLPFFLFEKEKTCICSLQCTTVNSGPALMSQHPGYE